MATTIEYNGVSLSAPLLTVRHEQAPEYDAQNNYLWQRHTLHVEGSLNVQTTAYAAPVNFAAPVATPGTMPATTEAAIRHQLSQQRGTLIYAVGGTNILRCPAAGATVDAHNGPVTIGTPIVERIGTKTFKIQFVVECYINEAANYTATPSVLLSNTYRMRETINSDFFSTRIIQGKAIFRSDRLAVLNACPDDFRSYFFFPVPTNFQREHIDVTVAENGTEAEYAVVDQERALNIIAPQGVTRIEATYSQTVVAPGMEEIHWQAHLQAARTGNAVVGVVGSGISRLGDVSSIISSGVEAATMARSLVPRINHEVSVRVWGDRNSSRFLLQQVAIQVIASKLNAVQLTAGAVTATVGHDLMGKYVEATCVLRAGPLQSIVEFGGGLAAGMPVFNFGNNDDIANITTIADAANPAPPGDAVGSRGTYLGALITAALLGQNAVPPRPQNPRNALNLQPP